MPPESAVLRTDGRGAGLAPLARWALAWSRWLSPAQMNPLDLNPLRDLVRRRFNFEALRRHPPLRLRLGATDVATGAARIFTEAELNADVLLASACLPNLFRPVALAGRWYWDGGYSQNPPVLALLEASPAQHVLLVLLSNPGASQAWAGAGSEFDAEAPAPPSQVEDIRLHVQELGFTAGLAAELTTLARWQDELSPPQAGVLARWWRRASALAEGPVSRRLAQAQFHRIAGGPELAHWDPTSRLAVHPAHIANLFDMGVRHAQAWLAQAGPAGEWRGQRLSALLSQPLAAAVPGEAPGP
jgi:NTE family protein